MTETTEPRELTFDIDGRTIVARRLPAVGLTRWRLYEGQQELTDQLDPWLKTPTEAELRSFLTLRKQRYATLMVDRRIVAGPDYDYFADYDLLYSDRPCGRWVAVRGDETYSFLYNTDDLAAASDELASAIGGEYGSRIDGIYDLDQDEMLMVAFSVRLDDASRQNEGVTLPATTAGP